MVLLGSLAAAALVATVFLFVRMTNQAGEENLYLPPMTIIYETDGPVVKSGDNPSQAIREVHRLQYRSRTEWTDTVVESQGADVVAGNFSEVYDTTGSYSRLEGGQLKEFNAYLDHLTEYTIEPNTIHLPTGALAPYHLEVLFQIEGIKRTSIATNTRVCYRDECEDNVGALLHTYNGQEFVFLDETRWDIPLNLGSRFVVREIRIDQERQ